MSNEARQTPTMPDFGLCSSSLNEPASTSPQSGQSPFASSSELRLATSSDRRRDRAPAFTVEGASNGSWTRVDTSEQTIIQWNITRFQNLLLTEPDRDRRRLLAKLLLEEQARLTQLLTQTVSAHDRGSLTT